MPGFTAFVSDLHLAAERAAAKQAFVDFLREVAPRADALYILGDLFEYWAGDDDLADSFNAQVVQALKQAAGSVPLFLLHGNRDFLLQERFFEASGVRLIPDPSIVDIYGVSTLLMHGDLLCTDDWRYQAFRGVVRNRGVQRLLLALPLSKRKALIGGARRLSEKEIQTKSMAIMDVNPTAVSKALRHSGCARLIHGHTHRPARHEVVVDSRECERWVLSDWYEHGQYLCVSRKDCKSIQLPFG